MLRMLEVTGARPAIDAVHPLADAPLAYARLAAGDTFGKMVLTNGA